jgi:hypothetical protein
VLSLVGLLPAMIAGLDVGAVREGAASVLDPVLQASDARDLPPAVGAALSVGLARERGIGTTVLMPYCDRLGYFGFWYRQLWAESLGKGGNGTTPVRAAVEAPSGAERVEFVVRDASGAVVRRAQVQPSVSGVTEMAWDGRADSGTVMPAGAYRIEALSRFGARGESAQVLLLSRVDSVTLDAAGRGIVLNTRNGSLPLGAVRRVM